MEECGQSSANVTALTPNRNDANKMIGVNRTYH